MLKRLGWTMTILLAAGAASAEESLEAIKKVEIGKSRELLVNGKPFFPIMSWAQDTSRFAVLRSLGFNTFCGSGKTGQDALEKAQAAGGYALISHTLFHASLKAHPALLAYGLCDEPDMDIDKGKPKVSAEEVLGWRKTLTENDPSRPIFLNFTGAFMQSHAGGKAEVKSYYEAAQKAGDILCFDIYPIYQENRDDRLIWVAEGVSELQAIAGPGKPVWAWIETSKGSKWITYERQKDVTPEIVRSEVWMAVIRGATGIGYFMHAWRPAFTEFAPDEAVRKELKRTNEQITRLSPAILSGPCSRKVAIAFEGGLCGEVLVREHEGFAYVFANNVDMKDLGERKDNVKASYRGGKATLKTEGLKAGTTIEVVDEHRTLTSAKDGFSDDFEPLGIHIYRWKP
ncbi:MAG: beta-galactosidase [Planctomycetes bacterium]|nr:beta-galactosidase [Planctomycetota bacterium]